MKAMTKMGERHHRCIRYDGNCEQQADWQRTEIDFSQRHLSSDILTRIYSEKKKKEGFMGTPVAMKLNGELKNVDHFKYLGSL